MEFDYTPTIYNLIENRNYQHKLRQLALHKFNNKCVISGKSDELLLETAHIKQVYECTNEIEKSDINNILLLWIDLHKYFDRYSLSINPNTLTVEISTALANNPDIYKYNSTVIGNLNNKTIRYLEHHYNLYNLNKKLKI